MQIKLSVYKKIFGQYRSNIKCSLVVERIVFKSQRNESLGKDVQRRSSKNGIDQSPYSHDG